MKSEQEAIGDISETPSWTRGAEPGLGDAPSPAGTGAGAERKQKARDEIRESVREKKGASRPAGVETGAQGKQGAIVKARAGAQGSRKSS